MVSGKNKKIILSVILLFIIIVGTFLIMKNNNHNSAKNSKNNESEAFQENKSGSENFYYVEKFIGEEEWDGTYKLFKYGDRIVRIIDGEKPYLREFKSGENIYDIPNKDMISGSGRWIDGNTFWNVRYDKERGAVIARSFENKGKQEDSIELKDFKGNIYEGSYIVVLDMKVSKNYIYLTVQTDTLPMLQIFTKTGELKNSYEHIASFDVDDRERCVYTTRGFRGSSDKGLFMIDLASGDEIFKNTSYIPDPIRFSEDGKFLYGFDAHRFDKKINLFDMDDGTVIKSVFEFGRDSTYILDDYYMGDFMVGEDGELYCSLMTSVRGYENLKSNDMKLFYYLYTKQEGERPTKETTLAITSPYRNDFMEEAIKRYELKYPDEYIEYDYAYNTYEEFLENTEEYGAKLILDIIAGDIGDITLTGGSGMELQDILRTDAFMDLTDLIEQDKSYKDLNKDVLNAIKMNNTIRGLPINYMFYQYELNEDLEKELGLDIDFNNISWSEVLDLVKVIERKTPDRHLFTRDIKGVSNWYAFSESLLTANMPDLIDLETKEVDLNQKWFKDLLIKFNECSESENFVLSDAEFDLNDRLQGSLMSVTLNRDAYYGDTVLHFDEYNKTNKSRMIPNLTGEKNNNRIGYSIRMYSIDNRSNRKESAWKFLSFLLEEDIQFIISKERTGMPINKKGVDRMIDDDIYMLHLGGSNLDRYNKDMIENSHKIDYLYNMGYLRVDMQEAISLYMDGEITLDEALKKAEEKVIIRLNE